MRTRSFISLPISALAVLAAACSSAPSDSAGGSDELTINPVGSEHESHLTLQLPTDACLPGGATCPKVLGTAPLLFVDGAYVALGASTRLKPGAHNVAVNGVSSVVTTAANLSQVVTLPVVRRACVDATLPNVPHTDFGSSVTVSNAACPTTATGTATGVPQVGSLTLYSGVMGATNACASSDGSAYDTDCARALGTTEYAVSSSTGCIVTGIGDDGCFAAQTLAEAPATPPGAFTLTDAYQAVAPGTLSTTVSGQTQTVTLVAGDEKDFTINLPASGTVPATFATTITFDDARANPDAVAARILSSCTSDRTYSIPAATGTPAPLSLAAFVAPACAYTLTVAGRTTTLSQTATNAIELHRLDVNDVTVTREDGSTYTTKGTYSLNYGGVQVAGPYYTGTGIDVLPGTYQFSLSYTDFDGPQTQTQSVTF